MESEPGKVMCKWCSCLFPINRILKHLSHLQPCKDHYSKEDFTKLKELCEAEAKRKTSIRKAINFKEKNLKQEDKVTNIHYYFEEISSNYFLCSHRNQ